MKNESITAVIATFNSEKYLQLVINSIKSQENLLTNIEILIIDGGSNDKTLQIAKYNQCKIIENINKDPISAKSIGICKATSKYVIFLDHDEVIENKISIYDRLNIFKKYSNVVAVLSSGYKNPYENIISEYINQYGDPFSFFIYRQSKSSHLFVKNLEKKYKLFINDINFIIPDFKNDLNIIIEIPALGSMIDLDYIKNNLQALLIDKNMLPHAFYYFIENNKHVAVMRNDPIHHYSTSNYSDYLKKISWRIKNNITNSKINKSGFVGREIISNNNNLKKYLFLIYAFSIIFPLIDSVLLILRNKNFKFAIHSVLILYTAYEIIRIYIIYKFKINIKKYNYDGSEDTF